MSFATMSNIATILFCIAVLIQTVRLMRCLELISSGGLKQVVDTLDVSTAEAHRVLSRLTELLHDERSVNTRTLQQGKAMIEELTVMTGIANAIAERIVDVAGASNRSTGDVAISGKTVA